MPRRLLRVSGLEARFRNTTTTRRTTSCGVSAAPSDGCGSCRADKEAPRVAVGSREAGVPLAPVLPNKMALLPPDKASLTS
jgi:hypothetical protein